MATAPNPVNYQIPTGHAFFTPDTGPFTGQRRDLGNVVNFKATMEANVKDHYRNYGGLRAKDDTRMTQAGATMTGELDEITGPNMSLFGLGDPITNSDGSYDIMAMSNTNFTGILEIVGDNDTGPRVDWIGKVLIVPDQSFNFMQDNDDYNKISFKASARTHEVYGLGKFTVHEAS